MKRNRRGGLNKEKTIMLASSVLVLTALTMTGIYMQTHEKESRDDGYTLDFTALEDDAEKKYQEIAENEPGTNWNSQKNDQANDQLTKPGLPPVDGDLDYMPLEAGSDNVKNPGLTDVLGETDIPTEGDGQSETPAEPEKGSQKAETEPKEQPGTSQDVIVAKELNFAESDGLLRPLEGEVLIPFSMNGSVFFSTLAQYKYNPALMLVATEGATVRACATGQVVNVFEDAEIGHAVTMDLGNGYQLTYGQLAGTNVSVGSYVDAGADLGTVAAPTKYFVKEGANLYLKLTANGTPIDPEALFR